jgi:CCR4-NOT transcriptional regulation complex NOT5 subunit
LTPLSFINSNIDNPLTQAAAASKRKAAATRKAAAAKKAMAKTTANTTVNDENRISHSKDTAVDTATAVTAVSNHSSTNPKLTMPQELEKAKKLTATKSTVNRKEQDESEDEESDAPIAPKGGVAAHSNNARSNPNMVSTRSINAGGN